MMPPDLQALMTRYCELGRSLPKGDDIALAVVLDDAEKHAEVEMILAEMRKVRAAIDANLAKAGRSRA